MVLYDDDSKVRGSHGKRGVGLTRGGLWMMH